MVLDNMYLSVKAKVFDKAIFFPKDNQTMTKMCIFDMIWDDSVANINDVCEAKSSM